MTREQKILGKTRLWVVGYSCNQGGGRHGDDRERKTAGLESKGEWMTGK